MIVYLDHAATSWPKPPGVAKAVARFLERIGANPGRSAHRLSIAAGRVLDDAREAVAALLGAPDPLRVAFGPNATWALNVAIHGLLRPGDRVVTSSLEHNSVMRPLRALERRGVEVVVVPASADGTLDPVDLEEAVTPGTRLVALNHASNVVGTILPVAEAGRIARERGALLLVDAAASAGSLDLDVARDGIDLLAFTGHKGLLGPPGTGGLVVGDRVPDLEPLVRGGTGSASEREEQPAFLPDALESGTPNTAGVAGLLAGLEWVRERGLATVRAEQVRKVGRLIEGLGAIPGVDVPGPADPEARTAAVSFTVAGRSPSEIGLRLDEEHGVLCRVGLHCAPAAHRTIGTFPAGTIRFAPGPFTTDEQLDIAIAAVAAIAGGGAG
jgi:cysteine desulfurase/selenocysteine lyase